VISGLVVAAALAVGVPAAASGVSPSSGEPAYDAGDASAARLTSIALSPLSLAAAPGGTQQLTVTGTFKHGIVRQLNAGEQTFTSSNPAIATVSPAGVVTVVAGALVGATATIGVINTAQGVAAMPGQTTVVTATTPSPNSGAAATATATDNALCGGTISPFYWEIGDQNGALASGSIGTTPTGPIVASTSLMIASASKLLYASYVVQVRGAAGELSAADIDFLHFTSGYTDMPEDGSTSVCPTTLSPDTINQCLTLVNSSGVSYSAQDPATVGLFFYNSGHMENHASQLMGSLGGTGVKSIGTTIAARLGPGVAFNYTEPLMAGGVTTSASTYALVLQHILSGSLAMRDALGTNLVCTLESPTCNAGYTPFTEEAWDYSIGHWVEDNPATNGDGAFNSAGSAGFYPWIDATKAYYGVLSRNAPNAAYSSVQCGRLIRRAFITGVEQTGTLPTE